MVDINLAKRSETTLSPEESPKGVIVKRENQTDIQVYKEVLSDRFAEAKSAEEYERILELRRIVQQLDVETRKLDFAEKSAEIQLKEAERQNLLQQSQQVVASIASIGVGIYFLQSIPLAGLLFLILGLAKPLGYSLSEIGRLLDRLKGFPKISDDFLNNSQEREDSENERT